jgi:hypothetical protein
MAFGKTYLTGNTGLFRVYNHSTEAWTDYTGFTLVDLYDVKTDKFYLEPDYAIICGLNYIGYTTSAGASVTQITPPIGSISAAYQISIPEGIIPGDPLYPAGIYIAGSTAGLLPGVIKSTDGGLTYTSTTTGLNPAFGNIALSIYFASLNFGILGHGGAIASTTDGGASWSYLNGGLVLAAGETVSGLLMSQDQQIIIATTDKKIYRSTNGGVSFSVVYTWVDPDYYTVPPKYTTLAMYNINPTELDSFSHLWVSGGNGPILYSSDIGITWSEVFPGQFIGDDNRQMFGASFYSQNEGFFTYDKGAASLGLVYKATNANTSISTTSSTVYFPDYSNGYSLWTTKITEGCGCEPGFFWDQTSQQCITDTPMCPEGLVYNPVTGDCEGTDPAGCDTDVAIVIDISGSISDTEMPEYKNMIRGIVDGLEMGYDANGNLNTLANSLGRITSGEIRVGIVLFAVDQFTPVGGVSLNFGPTAWEAGGANNSPAGTVANPGLLKAAINSMGTPIFSSPVDSYGIVNTVGFLYTNSFAGLGRGYDVVWGLNSRPAANKKILFVTDGWPNYIDPSALLSTYGVTLPSIITTFGTTPGLAVCGTFGLDDINSVIQATYQDRRLADYIATMDLAQEIKAGTAITSTGAPAGATDITLLVTGLTIEQNITKTAFVGIDPTDAVTPCYLDTSSIFGTNIDSNKDNGALDVPFLLSPGECPSWQGSYTSSDKFPSNAVSGLPDYYQTDLIPSSYAGIGLSISASLVCNISQSALTCNNPCQIIQDPTTLVYYCNCVSSTPFNTCCYDLINCADNTIYASVNTTGQDNDFMAQFIDQYIFIEGVAACLYVSLNNACTSSTTLNVTVDQITAYVDCIDCNLDNEVIPYYNLIKCGETTPLLQTTTDLSSYLTGGINQNLPILTFVEYPDICFTIEETFTFLPQVVVTVDVAYNDCPTCLSYLC